MYFNPKIGTPTPAVPTPKIEQSPVRQTPAAGTPAIAPDRSDRVEISDAGRALAARDGATESSELSPERIAQLRQRVLDGAYNSLEVVDEVARRILARGDL
ncbi:MAG TPA: flagellar biosynthesis anti-sigma factor FlgM [Gemmatimonadaceae bacterium]|nr:flagellar biosynthesis anti-sigma factor FlgM [Gemmatimonadaceae bacterium]